ncbi:hypothetical protein NG799_01540 [Laspinema sp. D1]|uniref:Uncharacterized protein n=1 Tax=Laspinema palackyanum D2a TaxID=2953684 RepID=A0ABT2MJT8_9CYAN|nr:hypothetical protein [Laspinema sp. D2a]
MVDWIESYIHQSVIQSEVKIQTKLEFAGWCAIASIGINTLSITTMTTIAVAIKPTELPKQLIQGGILGLCLGAIASISFIKYSITQIRKIR